MAAVKTIMVYDTKKQKEYPIHPSMANDKAWLAARGLIIQQEAKPFVATNLPSTPEVPVTKTNTKK